MIGSQTEGSDFDSYGYAADAEEAASRAEKFRYLDPFETIPPALLSSQDFIRYVKVTAMIHPFHEKPERIKAASYEIQAGKKAIWWDESGRKHERSIDERNPLFLQKNSITFVQIESTIRLPQYIALRFNLRIRSVHRGLLLGTGPLIDPEFVGDILVPIHNLTDQDYEIPAAEGLIWVEFTKTSSTPGPDWLYRIEPRKSLQSASEYLEKANGNNPIRSSLGGALAESRKRAVDAEIAAQSAQEYVAKIQRYAYYASIAGGVGALFVAVSIWVALHSYFGQMASLAGAVQNTASTALAKAEGLTSRADEDRKSSEEAKKSFEDLKRSQDAANREIELLRNEVAGQKAARAAETKPTTVKKAIDAGQVRRRRGRLR